MLESRDRLYMAAGAVIALLWISLVVVDPYAGVSLGFFLGACSAQISLAAAWGVVGLPRFLTRQFFSISWIVCLWIAIWVNFELHLLPREALLIVAASFLAQWLLLQAPLWGLTLGLRLRLRHRSEAVHPSSESDALEPQFGLRHLFLILLIAGLVLGTRAIVVYQLKNIVQHDVIVFLLLGFFAVVMSFPLLFGALLPRRPVTGAALSLLFIVAATKAEISFAEQVLGRDVFADCIATNVISALVTLVITALVRMNGFRLQMTPRLEERSS